jgi:hypothetical protein
MGKTLEEAFVSFLGPAKQSANETTVVVRPPLLTTLTVRFQQYLRIFSVILGQPRFPTAANPHPEPLIFESREWQIGHNHPTGSRIRLLIWAL